MALNFDSLVIDRVVNAAASDFDGNVLYLLKDLSNVSINTTSESKDKTDSLGVLIKRFYTAKTVEFSADVSMLSFSLMGEQFGSAREQGALKTPRFYFIPSGSSGTIHLPDLPLANITKMYEVNTNGTLGQVWTASTSASAEAHTFTYASHAADGQEATDPHGEITLPASYTTPCQMFVKYEYEATNAVKVANDADKFPRTVELVLSVLVADSCDVDTIRHAYVVFPSFQLSPDVDITLDTESTFTFNGVAQVDYCAEDKNLYYIILSEDDIDE